MDAQGKRGNSEAKCPEKRGGLTSVCRMSGRDIFWSNSSDGNVFLGIMYNFCVSM